MKLSYLVCLLTFSLSFGPLVGARSIKKDGHQQTSPLLVVLLMVKNEKEVIIPTLQTFLAKNRTRCQADTGEVAYILYDTGSTDGTQALAQEFFRKNGIRHHKIENDQFVDFATSRNRALEVARKTYPNSTFILFPDAEWYMHNFDDLLEFCKTKKSEYKSGVEPPPYYCIRMSRNDYISLTPRLFLTNDSVKFEGVVHECPTVVSQENAPSSCYLEIGVSKFGSDKSQQRWHRDRELLLNEHRKNPDDPRTVLYLGLTENWLEDYDNAYTHLKKRITMRSFPEEEYYALYNLAEVTEMLMYSKPEKHPWSEALGYYMQAHEMRPQRAEPLVRIAHYYLEKGNYPVSFLFARRAAELPIPTIEKEIMPVLTDVYKFDRWEVLSRAAWYVREYELGERAAKMAIEGNPNATYLYKNLSYYWERDKEIKREA